jgi:hypothetical protein
VTLRVVVHRSIQLLALLSLLVLLFMLIVDPPRAEAGTYDVPENVERVITRLQIIDDEEPRRPPQGDPVDPLHFETYAGRSHAFTGDGTENRWTAGVLARLLPSERTQLSIFLRLDSLPGGKPVDLTLVDSWDRAANLAVELSRQLKRYGTASRWVKTSVVVGWEFYVALTGEQDQRYARAYGLGVSFETSSRAFFTFKLGRDQRCGPLERGQFIVSGRSPVIKLLGKVGTALQGKAALNVFSERVGAPGRRDIFTLDVVVLR